MTKGTWKKFKFVIFPIQVCRAQEAQIKKLFRKIQFVPLRNAAAAAGDGNEFEMKFRAAAAGDRGDRNLVGFV